MPSSTTTARRDSGEKCRPAYYREAIMLVELEELTQQAAAGRLGLSLSGMKSRVQRGRKQLRQMLDACCLIQLDRRGGVAEYERRPKGDALCGASPCDTP